MSWYVIQEKHAISSHLHTIQESNADSFSSQKTKRRNQFGISFSLIHWHENTRFVRFLSGQEPLALAAS